MDDEDHDDQRGATMGRVVAVVAVAVLIVIVGSIVMVRALGLNSSESDGPVTSQREQVDPLPTSALPDPDQSRTADPGERRERKGATDSPTAGLRLTITPVYARPMERVNLTGTYQGEDNMTLEVQRLEGGAWKNFGVQAQVTVGAFDTFVMTGREGDNKFRVFDPRNDVASNAVAITVD